ncbi:hypothetical protein SBDP1_270045 [Syntrophobacter sp. SbD1]|nr:hypothetical protein SBDP1_270045 [Syntrophobacter sp. SbD1]
MACPQCGKTIPPTAGSAISVELIFADPKKPNLWITTGTGASEQTHCGVTEGVKELFVEVSGDQDAMALARCGLTCLISLPLNSYFSPLYVPDLCIDIPILRLGCDVLKCSHPPHKQMGSNIG